MLTRMVAAVLMGGMMWLGAPVGAEAQGICEPIETVTACLNRIRVVLGAEPDRTAVATTAKNTQLTAGKKTETGLDALAGLGSTVKDFVPLLQTTGLLGGINKDEKTGIVAIALNTPFLGSTGNEASKDKSLQLKATVDTTAELFEPLKKLIPEGDRDEVAKQLIDAKPEAQNLTLHASYNILSRRLGRNFSLHQDTLDALFTQALGAVAGPRAAFTLRVLDLANAVPLVNFNTALWSTIGPGDRATIEAGILAIIKAEKEFDAILSREMKAAGLDVYGQLVNNQPQLALTVTRGFRDDLFGPDLVTGRVSFEMGVGNTLNAAVGRYNGTCDTTPAACLKAYSAFASRPSTRAAIKAGNRLSVFAEFVHNFDYHYTSAAPALDLTIVKGTGWSAGLDYGRLVGVDDTGTASGRVDSSIQWEDPAQDGVDSRFVASLTVTKKLGDLSIPFGIVYANKEKFLTGVDHGLSANVGLKFNLFPGTK